MTGRLHHTKVYVLIRIKFLLYVILLTSLAPRLQPSPLSYDFAKLLIYTQSTFDIFLLLNHNFNVLYAAQETELQMPEISCDTLK